MPRERVHHGKIWKNSPLTNQSEGEIQGVSVSEYTPDTPVRSGEYLVEDPSMDIDWNRDHGYVQVSIDMPRETWIERAKSIEDDSQIIKSAVYTNTLTRKEINHMIRTLRRARDAAFGRDE